MIRVLTNDNNPNLVEGALFESIEYQVLWRKDGLPLTFLQYELCQIFYSLLVQDRIQLLFPGGLQVHEKLVSKYS